MIWTEICSIFSMFRWLHEKSLTTTIQQLLKPWNLNWKIQLKLFTLDWKPSLIFLKLSNSSMKPLNFLKAEVEMVKYKNGVNDTSSKHLKTADLQCVISGLIRSFSGSYFLAFWLNTEIYLVNLCIQSECGKIRIPSQN